MTTADLATSGSGAFAQGVRVQLRAERLDVLHCPCR